MKLSCKKKFGWIHVRGGQVLRVATSHAVPTGTYSVLADEDQPAGHAGVKAVWAQEGDVAIEIIACKTGKCLGYSYLSGPALQLNHYEAHRHQGWCEVVGEVGLLEIPRPHGEPKAFMEEVMALLVSARHSPPTVSAFRYRCSKHEDPERVADVLLNCLRYTKKDAEATAHVLGVVTGHRRKGPVVTIHCQPPHHADDCHATSFQIELALSAARANKKENSDGPPVSAVI